MTVLLVRRTLTTLNAHRGRRRHGAAIVALAQGAGHAGFSGAGNPGYSTATYLGAFRYAREEVLDVPRYAKAMGLA